MSDHKLAADAIRSAAEWKNRAELAEAKVASYERKERVAQITKKAEAKGALLPKNLDLTKCSEHILKDLERSLDLLGPNGGIKLGSPEDDTPGSAPARQRDPLDEYVLHPDTFEG